MAELPDLQPYDVYQPPVETPSHYERMLGQEYPDLSPDTGGVVIDVKNKTATILVSAETREETDALSEEFKKEFIKKLEQLPDYEGSKVQEAIEKQTIEIKKIPGRDGYAIYESKVGNLVYIARVDGSKYENIHKYRNKDLFGSMIIGGYVRQGLRVEFNNGLWELYEKNGTKIPINSDQYRTATLNSINFMRGEMRLILDSEEDSEVIKKLGLDI